MVKRSGLEEGFALSGTGQGVHTRSKAYAVVEGALTELDTLIEYSLEADELPYMFLDLPTATGDNSFLVKSTASLYVFEE